MTNSVREKSWMEDVEELLRKKWKEGEVFRLSEAYSIIEELQRRRPRSARISDTVMVQTRIRDALQQLRNRKRISFLGSGTYSLS